MKKSNRVLIKAVDSMHLRIENNNTTGFDGLAYLENTHFVEVRGNVTVSSDALEFLDKIKQEIIKHANDDLPLHKKDQILSLLDDIKHSGKKTAFEKLEVITSILSSCVSISPLLVPSIAHFIEMIS